MVERDPVPTSPAELLSYTSRELAGLSGKLGEAIDKADRAFGYRGIRRRVFAGLRKDLEDFDETNEFQQHVKQRLGETLKRLRLENRNPWKRYNRTCYEGLAWSRLLGPTMDAQQAGALLLLAVGIYHTGVPAHPALPAFLRAPDSVDPRKDFGHWASAAALREDLERPEMLERLRWAWLRMQSVPRGQILPAAAADLEFTGPTPGSASSTLPVHPQRSRPKLHRGHQKVQAVVAWAEATEKSWRSAVDLQVLWRVCPDTEGTPPPSVETIRRYLRALARISHRESGALPGP